jgi:hypothetical protein
VIVVDDAKVGDLAIQGAVEVDEVGIGLLGQVDGDPSGDDEVEEIAGSEGSLIGAEEIFFEARELSEAEGEACVVA